MDRYTLPSSVALIQQRLLEDTFQSKNLIDLLEIEAVDNVEYCLFCELIYYFQQLACDKSF